jgi:hypothetical protein
MSIVSDHHHDTYDLAEKCPACGVQWVDHCGAISLCDKLQHAKRVIDHLLRFVEQPDYSRDIGEMECYFDLIEEAENIVTKY